MYIPCLYMLMERTQAKKLTFAQFSDKGRHILHNYEKS